MEAAEIETIEQRETVDGKTDQVRAPADSNPNGNNSVHRLVEVGAGAVTDYTGIDTHHDGEPGAAPGAKPAFEFSLASPHIHRGSSVENFRGTSGGIYWGRNGRIYLPSLTSITFAMSRLPEDDAGLQMHLTQMEEVESRTSNRRRQRRSSKEKV